ncbi:MAG: fused MFS/spermidine synthase [Candidatus Hydrogenedentes bacterium]|nr:fused MFS/spermidine synthase [Candidatus Hydrogenedentota bacterium]
MSVQNQSSSFLPGLCLGILVFVSGAAVMIYEFIAVRMLQRFYGSSLEVWSAEISVCLLGLAAGYSLGGLLADRYRSWLPLGIVLIIAGITASFMEPIVMRMGESVAQSEMMRWWEPLVASAAATLAPLLALGTVMPQAIRLAVTRIEKLGAGAGRIAALSTIGSICGTLATSTLFVQWGVRESLYATCGVLIAGGILIMIVHFATRRMAAAISSASAILLLSQVATAQTIYEDYSAYHHILVHDEDGKRVLYFDSSPQTTMNTNDTSTGGFEYTDFFYTPLVLNPTMKSALFVGLGGGTGPKAFLKHFPDMKIDVSEIDPAVVKVAKKYFEVPEDSRLRIVTIDGRTFIQRSKQTYGAIIMDAYASGPNGAYLPYHLATEEFFNAAKERIENGGCLVYNVMGEYGGSNDKIVRGMVKTLEAVFQHVYVFQAESSWNTVFVAQKIDHTKLAANGTVDGKVWPEGPWMAHPANLSDLAAKLIAQDKKFPADFVKRLTQYSAANSSPRDGTLYTDNNAPVDIAQGR